MMITGLCRLTPTRAEIGGWPPLAVSFQHPQGLGHAPCSLLKFRLKQHCYKYFVELSRGKED
jgi:hypothetical protein